MFRWARSIASRITGISTPFGGVSWRLPERSEERPERSGQGNLPSFHGHIYITYSGNDKYIDFLEANNRRIVFLEAHVDASIAIEEQHQIVQEEQIDLHQIASGSFGGVSLPLPNKRGTLTSIVFYFSNGHKLRCSQGGTGIVTVGVSGFFEVAKTYHGGPSTTFYLTEVGISTETKISIFNQ